MGGPGGQRCKQSLCRQRIVPVPRIPGMHSGRGLEAVASFVAWVCGRERLSVTNNDKKVTLW